MLERSSLPDARKRRAASACARSLGTSSQARLPARPVCSANARGRDRASAGTSTSRGSCAQHGTLSMEAYEKELFRDMDRMNLAGWTPALGPEGLHAKPAASLNATFAMNTGLVKPIESGIDLGGPADAHTCSLLRTHELEVERMNGTLEVLRRMCDDERAGRAAAQAEVQRLRTEAATKSSSREQSENDVEKMRRRIAQLERQLDLAKVKANGNAEQARRLQDGLLDAQRERQSLERDCRQVEQRLRKSEVEQTELTQALREANQARASLASRLEKVVPAYSQAKQQWGEQKRELVRHVEHYRKAALRTQVHADRASEGGAHSRAARYNPGLSGSMQPSNSEKEPPETTGPTGAAKVAQDALSEYAASDNPNYSLMAYVNELVLENQKLKTKDLAKATTLPALEGGAISRRQCVSIGQNTQPATAPAATQTDVPRSVRVSPNTAAGALLVI
jgi:predicted  nucleic acid-binding Zn-ribbon protein